MDTNTIIAKLITNQFFSDIFTTVGKTYVFDKWRPLIGLEHKGSPVGFITIGVNVDRDPNETYEETDDGWIAISGSEADFEHWRDFSISFPRRAPDQEFDSDEEEEAYNLGSRLKEELAGFLAELRFENANMCFQIIEHPRHTYAELCAFYPDDPALHDMPWA